MVPLGRSCGGPAGEWRRCAKWPAEPGDLAQHMRQRHDGNGLDTRVRDVHLLGCACGRKPTVTSKRFSAGTCTTSSSSWTRSAFARSISGPTPGRTRRLVRCRARARLCASGHTTSYGHGYPADNVEILKTLLYSQHVASPHESDEPRRQAEAESSTACRNADLQGILRGVPARHVTSGQLDRGACTFE